MRNLSDGDGLQLELGQPLESEIESNGKRYLRAVVRTHYVEKGEDIGQVVNKYMGPLLQPSDWVVVSEKLVSISRGNYVEESDVKPGWWARFLTKYVERTPSGPGGVGSPEKMQLAIEKVGLIKILFAAAVAFVTKLFGSKGWFYRIVGPEISTVDGQTGPPGWPARTRIIFPVPFADEVAASISETCGHPVIIADMNNISGTIKGCSHGELRDIDFVDVLRDNPMGQMQNMTPIGLIRPIVNE